METAYEGFHRPAREGQDGSAGNIGYSSVGAARHDHNTILLVENEGDLVIELVDEIVPALQPAKTGMWLSPIDPLGMRKEENPRRKLLEGI